MTIAATILAQLGGNRFIAMTGAKNLVNHSSALTFRIGRNASKANMVRITLDGNDTYTVDFIRFANLDMNTIRSVAGIYVDQLRSVFTDTTGLICSL